MGDSDIVDNAGNLGALGAMDNGENGDNKDAAQPAEQGKAAAPVTRELPTVQLSAQAQAQAKAPGEQEREGDETLERPVPRSRPKKTTLAMAIVKSPESSDPSKSSSRHSRPSGPAANALPIEDAPTLRRSHFAAPAGELPAGVADEADDWAIADQPTVYLPPERRILPSTHAEHAEYSEQHDHQDADERAPHAPGRRPAPSTSPVVRRPIARPAGPQATPSGQRPPYPPRRDPRETRLPNATGSAGRVTPTRLGGPNGPIGPNGLPSPNGPRRLATPDGRPMPGTPPNGVPRAALPDPRMERFQRLREGRIAHQDGERTSDEPRHVTEIVRQWWRDLRPNLNNALNYQREARASGAHPIPATEPAQGSRLGDAFGRLTASARGMTERAQQALSPQINRLQELHGHAENAANALVQKIEGPAARQQAPFLGPGRIAIFFKQGVTVGQAQALLSASHARPIRLIPRKHGFLALVAPGEEAEVSERLRVHPYVRDVAYLEYDEYGEPLSPQ